MDKPTRTIPHTSNQSPTNLVKNAAALAVGFVSCTILPGEVFAQDRRATTLEEVIVTARRRDESLQDVPISISALDAGFLEKSPIVLTEDLQFQIPGLTYITAGARKDTLAPSLRGQRNNDVLGVSDPSVATYFGDALVPRPIGSNNTLYDLESIQVLNGVQGTLFGRNTTGGAIVINPAPPTHEFDARLKATYGKYDHMQLEGMVNTPLGEAAALRIAGSIWKRDGTSENIETGQEQDSRDIQSFRVSLLLTPTERIESKTIYDYYHHDQDSNALSLWAFDPSVGAIAGLIALHNQADTYPFFPRLAQMPDLDELLAEQKRLGPFKVRSEVGTGIPSIDPYHSLDSENDNWGIQNVTTFEFDTFSIKNILAYRDVKIDTIVDLDGGLLAGISSQQRGDGDFWSEELQFLGTAMDGKLDWIVGVFYMDEDGEDNSTSMQFNDLRTENTRIGFYNAIFDGTNQEAAIAAANAAGDAAAVLGYTSGLWKNKSTAIYTGLTYRLNEKWTLAGGLRYTEDERGSTATHRNQNLSTGILTCQYVRDGAPLPIEDCHVPVDDKWDEWTYDATLTYNFSDASMVYGSFRHGYKTGGFNGRARDEIAQTPFDAELVDEYEIGFKSDFAIGETLARFNGAFYYQDYTDLQRQTALQFGDIVVTIINNAADATIKGSELELLLIPSPNLELRLFYSYIDGEYDSFVDRVSGQDRSNEWLTRSPKHMYGANLSYTFPLEGSSEIVLTLNAYGQSKSHIDDDDAIADQPSYEIYNARLDWQRVAGSQFSIGIWGRNLGDEEYAIGTVSILGPAGTSGRVWGDPVTYGIDVTYQFRD